MTIPVFITCRDRLESLPALIDYLERAGCTDIYLLDNASTYPPLLEFYSKTPHNVVELGVNLGHQALWRSKALERFSVEGPFVLSDSDVVPVEDCPLDAIDHFAGILERHPSHFKVGFGLKIDDIPDCYRFKDEVVAWESRFWDRPIAEGLYEAPIGTTFALYRAHSGFHRWPSIRTGHPYLVRHTTWYADSSDLPEDQRFYRDNIPDDTSRWDRDTLWPRVEEGLRAQRRPAR